MAAYRGSSMPDGDIRHAAAALRSALVDHTMVRFEAPRLVGITPRAGRLIESVESHGRHLDVQWDDGVVLHTHMRMSGSWHLYRDDESWQHPHQHLRALIEVDGWRAVCFNAPVVETYRAPDATRHPGLRGLGPDLCPQRCRPRPLRRSCSGPTTIPTPRWPRCSSTNGCSAGSATCSAARCCTPASSARSPRWRRCPRPTPCASSTSPPSSLRVEPRRRRAHARRPGARRLRAHRPAVPALPRGGRVPPRPAATRASSTGARAARCASIPGATPLDDTQWLDDPHPAARRFLRDLPWRRTG